MATRYTVTVIDVNNRPLANAQVTLGTISGVTDGAGRWSTDATFDPAQPLTLKVDHAYHVLEKSTFTGLPGVAEWDNPLVTPVSSGTEVSLGVRLGRMDTSPVLKLTDEQVAALMKTPQRDPDAVRLFDVPRFNGVVGYHLHWNDQKEVQVPRAQLLPSKAVAPGTRSWHRLLSKGEDADLAAYGRFYWLEYAPRPSRPRYAVAVWSPNLPFPVPPPALDYVVFYSPTTQNEEYKDATYPYGLVNASAPFQKYMELAKKYLLDEFFFAYQMVAQRNRAVLVMPIANYGDLGPFASGEGLLRALREIGLFLHRQCRTSVKGVRPPRPSNPSELAGPNLRSNTPAILDDSFGSVPAVGSVAVSGFSTGITPVKSLMSENGWAVSLDSMLWGVPAGPGAMPQSVWRKTWRELWDLDGFHPATGGWPPYLDLLQRWLTEQPDRVLRSYHTSSRVPPNPLTDPHKVWKYLAAPALDIKISLPWVEGIGNAQQLQNSHWTSFTARDLYLIDGEGQDQLPLFIDAHHTTPRVGFPHALKLTKVGVPSP
ncbi:carboxypeptidase-like regulatory domain-containing protein [Streptomyces sp. NBC_01007]|nr:carboxypeptidase-like regulatory domain-containing protein [Streptomyces sp. NBC_01007]